ncbi:ADAMTS-like protein 1 [Thrips palmi]|uniref:ADAMTS-like protein 1 n=1 Tax=Thrips palmi TaxID=161013 RepID=A0A6P9AAT2_THRPL|nr:ADAMTS-like protein 1 [Thrips palmi]
MLPGNLLTLPLAVLVAFSNESRWSEADWEESPPRTPSPLQPPGRWSTATWGECSNPCGAGEERRLVSCVLEDVTGTLLVAADGFCAPPKPATARQCYQYRTECANAWVTGDWGQCSAKCGGGQRSRLVECHNGRPEAALASVPAPLADVQCVPQLRPADRRECNLQPCPDGRRVWLRTSDGRKPRRIRLYSKFTLRCPFQVFWTPADDRTKRKYAWYKDGQRLPVHEDKYTQTDNRGELRVKGADVDDSGVYACASLTADPQGRIHNMTVVVERVAGDPVPTAPPPPLEEADDSPEELDGEPAAGPSSEAPPESSTSPSSSPPEETTTSAPSSTVAEVASTAEVPTESPSPAPDAGQLPQRRKRDLDDADSSSPIIAVVAARYDAAPFSNCSEQCGATGLRQRAVRCVDNETGTQLALADCEDLGPPPPPQEPCNRVDCPAAWQWPSWAGIKCSRPCGGGAKWRQAHCSQRLATGDDVILAASHCAHLGPGEDRRDCHRAACRSRVREGELLRLECRAANATWKYQGAGGVRSVDVANEDKYLADNDTGTLYVYTAAAEDAGLYLCQEDEGDGVLVTHRYEVVVLPASTPPPRSQGDDDDLFVRVWAPDTTTTSSDSDGTTAASEPEGPEASSRPGGDPGGDSLVVDDPGYTTEPTPPKMPIPWEVLFLPAAPTRGNMLTIFT